MTSAAEGKFARETAGGYIILSNGKTIPSRWEEEPLSRTIEILNAAHEAAVSEAVRKAVEEFREMAAKILDEAVKEIEAIDYEIQETPGAIQVLTDGAAHIRSLPAVKT